VKYLKYKHLKQLNYLKRATNYAEGVE